MKKLILLTVVGMLFFVYACGGGGDDPKSVMKDYFAVMEDFVGAAEKAGNADDVVAAINKFSDSMKQVIPRLKALGEKYPELKNMGQGNLPPEFKEFETKLQELMPRFMGAFGKLAQYASDPKVMEAQKKMQEAMQAL